LNLIDYEILNDTVFINQGDSEAEFLVRIYYSDKYFATKNITLELSQVGDNLILIENLSSAEIQIESSVITCWGKYVFPADSLFGFGIFRTNKSVSNSNEIFNFQLQNSDASGIYLKNSFVSNFTYEVECVNRGAVAILYDGEYGGDAKEVNPGEVVFTQIIEEEFKNLSYILPSNSGIFTFTDDANILRTKFRECNYEFIIKNIQPVIDNSNNISDLYENVLIPSEKLPALDIIKSKKTSEIWKNLLRDVEFFQTQNIGTLIFERGIRNSILPDLDLLLQQNINRLLLSFDYTDDDESFFDLNPLSLLVRKSIYALRTRISNIYYPRPKFTNYNPISTNIETSLLDNNFIKTGVVKDDVDMFGTLILNKSMNGQSATKIVFRKFSNRLDLINLLVPSQITFNKFYQESDSDFYFEYKKYFKYDYRVLEFKKFGNVFIPNNVNIFPYPNEKLGEDVAQNAAISQNSASFNDSNFINFVIAGVPIFNALRIIKFDPNSSIDINSFSDSIIGVKPLPGYIPIDINSINNRLVVNI
jgi:hypothetical protein